MGFFKDKVLAPVAGKVAHHTSSSTAHKAVEAVGTVKVKANAIAAQPQPPVSREVWLQESSMFHCRYCSDRNQAAVVALAHALATVMLCIATGASAMHGMHMLQADARFVVTHFASAFGLRICHVFSDTSKTVFVLLQMVGAMEYLGPDAAVKVCQQAVLHAAPLLLHRMPHHQTRLQQQ
jgi:hypothetical protein